MAHSFTQHVVVNGAYLHTLCTACGCRTDEDRATLYCPTAGKHMLLCVCSLLDMLSACVFIHAPIHSYCLIVVLCVFDTAEAGDGGGTRRPSKITSVVSCLVTLTHGEQSIELWVMADTGFTDDISLEPCDLAQLHVKPVLDSKGKPRVVEYEQSDNSIVQNWLFEPVEISIALEDGEVRTATLNPVASAPSAAAETETAAVAGVQRLLGFGALTKLDLKVDCHRHRLCKRKHRK
jgi:hypothetical protein